METKKNPSRNLERRKPSLLFTGLLMALATVLVAFEWTTVEEVNRISNASWSVDFIEEEIIPVSRMKAPPPPPPPVQTEIFKIVDEPEPVTEPVEFIEPVVDPEPVVHVISPIVEVIDEPIIYDFAAEMPQFHGGEAEMYRYLGGAIDFPEIALEAQLSGVVYVTFVVDVNGEITDVELLKGIGGGCDEEALRVVRNMPAWIPGKQNGIPVKVRFNMPIRFSAR